MTQVELAHDERFIEMARVRRRPKTVTVTLPAYRARVGEEPAVGHEVPFESGVTAEVVAIADGQVTLRFRTEPGTVVATGFGPGHVREADDHFEIEIDARDGQLVRAGPLVGRVVDVTDASFTLDFGHPFGGEALHCEVKPGVSRGPVQATSISHE